jgi:hypothetical protein
MALLAPVRLLLSLNPVCARLQEIAEKINPVFQAAPTGIAAFNIIGKALDNLLRFLVKSKSTSAIRRRC